MATAFGAGIDAVVLFHFPFNSFQIAHLPVRSSFRVRVQVHCENGILNIRIFAFNLHELKYIRRPF